MKSGGLHHVTAIASTASRSLNFYTGALGMKLVKRTVSHVDPGSYHLYFGDEIGRPGTIFSVFVWKGCSPGRRGKGEPSRIALRVPTGSIGRWYERLRAAGVENVRLAKADQPPWVLFDDPDGVPLALAEEPAQDEVQEMTSSDENNRVVGLHGANLVVEDVEWIADLLGTLFDFRVVERSKTHVTTQHGGKRGTRLTLEKSVDQPRGRLGRGTIRHVALRAADARSQDQVAERLRSEFKIATAGPFDRVYYRSVYFREPSGLLLEIATDGPGFTVDEEPDQLGLQLTLPSHMEKRRDELVKILPPLP